MAEKTTSQKKKSILLPVASGSLLVALAGLFFLPQLLSTDWAVNKVIETVSDRAPGKVDFDSMSLGWFSPVRIQGITYDDPAAGVLVKVGGLTTAKGLLALATSYKEPGEVTITDPALFITVKEESAQPAPAAPPGQPSTQSSVPATDAAGETKPQQPGSVAFPAVTVQLNITGGRVIARLPEADEKEIVKGLELNLKVAGLDNLLEYLVDFQSGDGKGKVHGKGTLALAPENPADLDKTVSQAALDITTWEIGDLLSILAIYGDLPMGSGQINGQVNVSGSLESGLALQGNLSAEQVKLHGGPLTTDSPSLDRVKLLLDAVQTVSTLTVNQLVLESPLASGTASGILGAGGEKKMVSRMVVDLAQLFTQFPATLKLKKGLTISAGQLNLDATLGGTDTTTSFDASALLDGLQGKAGKSKISLDKPITVQARGEQSSTGLRLDNFNVQSSFANGQGQGDMNKMQLTLAADLGAALKEIEKFIQVEDWKSTGKMDLKLQVDTKTESLRALSAELAIKDFVLQQKGRVIAPSSGFKANLITDLSLDDQLRPQKMTDTALDIQSWLGTTSLHAKNLVPPSEKKGVQVDGLDVKGAFKLDQLTVLLHSIEKLPGDTGFAGSMDIESRISLHDDKLQLSDTRIDVSDLLLHKESQKMREKNLRVTTRGEADLKAKTAAFKPLEIVTTAGTMVFPQLAISDWSQPALGVKTAGNIKLDLDLLTKLLGDFIQLPAKTSIAGMAELDLKVDLTAAKQQSIQMEVKGSNIKVISENKPPITEDSLHLAMDLKGDVDAQNLTLGKLELSTVPVSFNATGQVAPNGKERTLNSEGSLTINLQAVSSYLKSLAGVDLEMTGKESSPFRIVATSSNGQWVDLPRNTTFSTSFYADSIRGFGMLIESLELPVELADSIGKIEIVGAVNKGTMSLKPTIDFSVEPPLVSIPENSPLLTAVGLTEGMSKDLLVHIHPIFKGAAVSRGTVDMIMKNFNWPLDKKAREDAAFSGSLTFNEVELEAGGLLAPLLEVMQVDDQDREIILSEQPMEFVGENGRIRCSPLEMSVNEYTLKLSGSIGFDQSLDYLAQIPVTRKMVSGDVYKYLEGTYISVPIGGTVSNPSISKNLVQTAIKDLAIQAGTKQITDQAGKLLQKLFQ